MGELVIVSRKYRRAPPLILLPFECSALYDMPGPMFGGLHRLDKRG